MPEHLEQVHLSKPFGIGTVAFDLSDFKILQAAGLNGIDDCDIDTDSPQVLLQNSVIMCCRFHDSGHSIYAYAIDYVIRHRCDLPKPDIDGLFPRNYPDYNYWEGLLVDKVNEYIEL